MVFGKQFARALTASTLIYLFGFPPSIFAQNPEHVVSAADMQKAAVDAARARQQNVDTLKQFFSSDKARKAMQASQIDPQQVKSAISTLSDEELAQMAARADHAQQDFAAGRMSDHDLLIILVCIAALILIIVAVH
jgi:hypothetical protein